MWVTQIEELRDGRGLKVAVKKNATSVSYAEVLDLWQREEAFRSFFSSFLRSIPYRAFRWETPAVTSTTASRSFEFVVTNSPELTDDPDPKSFAEHFVANPVGDVVTFPNLGKDAELVVPCPKGPIAAYGHLAVFVRDGSEAQQHSLWNAVGAAMVRRLGSKPVWLSTAGAGVAWLHVRLDDRPKYYSYTPYTKSG